MNKIHLPGRESSIRIKTLNPVPIIPAQAPENKYNLPISLWLVDINHLRNQYKEEVPVL